MSKRFTGHSLAWEVPAPALRSLLPHILLGRPDQEQQQTNQGLSCGCGLITQQRVRVKKPGQQSRVPTPYRGREPNSFSRQEENGKGPHLQRDHTGPALKETQTSALKGSGRGSKPQSQGEQIRKTAAREQGWRTGCLQRRESRTASH